MQPAEPKELQHYLKNFPLRKIKQGETVLFQGEVPRSVYVIKSGAIKAYNIDANGEEKIVAFVGPNEIMAPSWVFGKSPVALYYYDTFADTEVFTMTRAELRALLRANTDALYAAFDKLVSVFIGANIHINALENSRSSQKIVHLLNYLAMRFGIAVTGNRTVIKIRLTQQDIARMLGLTRETVATELSALKKQGVLTYQSQHYTVNTYELQKLQGEEEFMNVSI